MLMFENIKQIRIPISFQLEIFLKHILQQEFLWWLARTIAKIREQWADIYYRA